MLGTRLSISFQYVSVDVSILFGVVRGCCHRLFVAVTVDCGFNGISQADLSLQCRRKLRAHVEDLLFCSWRFICWIRLVQFWKFILSISLFFCVVFFCFA
jgi:hypothetical protein